MKRHKVLLTNAIHPEAVKILEEIADIVVAENTEPETLYKAIAGVDAFMVRVLLPPDIFEYADQLQVTVRHGVGLDFIPVEAATAKGIPVANVPGTNTLAVAEHVVGMFLMLSRQFHRLILDSSQRDWNIRNSLLGAEVFGKTVGIVGLGRIGSRVASICQNGFEMTVLAYDPYAASYPDGVQKASLETIFEKSDFVTFHVPLTPETERFINAEFLSLLKPTSFLVNASRGPVIDEAALIQVLSSGRIAGAALDVFEEEPLPPEHPYFSLGNVLITPHCSGLTAESLIRMGTEAAKEVVRALKGEKPINLVNPEIWGQYIEKYHSG